MCWSVNKIVIILTNTCSLKRSFRWSLVVGFYRLLNTSSSSRNPSVQPRKHNEEKPKRDAEEKKTGAQMEKSIIDVERERETERERQRDRKREREFCV